MHERRNDDQPRSPMRWFWLGTAIFTVICWIIVGLLAVKFGPSLSGALGATNQGDVHFEQGNLDAAKAQYDTAILFNPQDAEAYVGRGNVLRSWGQIEAAMADYATALDIDPTLETAYVNRGIAHLEQSHRAIAIVDFNQALSLNPDLAEAYFHRGTAHYMKSDFDAAIEDYSLALEADASLSGALINRALASAIQGDLDQAVADFDKAAQQGDNCPAGDVVRWMPLDDVQEIRDSLYDLRSVLNVAPDDACSYYLHGVLNILLGEGAKALHHMEMADSLAWEDYDFDWDRFYHLYDEAWALEQLQQTENWSTLVIDPFVNPTGNPNDWSLGPDSSPRVTEQIDMISGKLVWDATAHQDVVSYMWPDMRVAADMVVTTEARLPDADAPHGATYGLLLRRNALGEYYQFAISDQEQQYFLDMLFDDEWTIVVPPTYTSAIRPGQVNLITAHVRDSEFFFFINHQYVGGAYEGTLDARSKAGLIVGLEEADDHAVFEFDNFEIRVPPIGPPE